MSMQETETYRESFRAPDARILIVDDTPMNLTVAVGLLKKTALQIDTAVSGAEAIELSKLSHYDLILMDHQMPGMDGVECMHRIKDQENGLCRESKMVCLTANV
jgi:CheY-like chemotaxis protein